MFVAESSLFCFALNLTGGVTVACVLWCVGESFVLENEHLQVYITANFLIFNFFYLL